MRKHHTVIAVILSAIMLSGCSLFGHSGVEIAPYTVLKKEDNLELRHYDRLILVSTPMSEGMDEQSKPFYKLYNYISGKNEKSQEISMTAPVFLGQAFQGTETMSFVLPADFSIDDAPKPQDMAVKLEEITNYTAAAIVFSGFLNQKNINKHKKILQDWIKNKGYTKIGEAKAAGYNPPFTIPALRRNEVLIPVEMP